MRWWRDIILERTYLGRHTNLVVKTLRIGMALFILSEVFFFVRFFWAFFYAIIGEISINKVGQWPPVGVKAISPWGVPALNTIILLASGVRVTCAHKGVRVHNKCPVFNTNHKVDGFGWQLHSRKALFSIVWGRRLVNGFRSFFHWGNTSQIPYPSGELGFPGKDVLSLSKREAARKLTWKTRFESNLEKFEGKGSELGSVLPGGYGSEMVLQLSDVKRGSFFPGSSSFWREQLALSLSNNSRFEEKRREGEAYRLYTLFFLGWTVFLGVVFTALQAEEYYIASFTIADRIYGSRFFIITGFHGAHVLAGTIFLIVVFIRTWRYHFCQHTHYFGFDAAVWYWHFVDVVWVGLFGVVYIWGYL